jgi:uncharacterized damage-inducible protein DinB
MSVLTLFKEEFESEVITTRKMLSRVPDDKFTWKPHPKSMDLKTLSVHIAELPTWIPMALNTDELDFATAAYTPKAVNNTFDLVDYFEDNVKECRAQLEKANESTFSEQWLLRTGDDIHVTTTRYGMMRIAMSQMIHHRAQLGVFLRLLDIPIPGSYGPSADEMNF